MSRLIALLLLPVLLVAEEDPYTAQVAPILQSSCIECHGPDKNKGKLRLDLPAHILGGGASGQTVVAGHPERSELLTRVRLPEDDDDRMPPKGPRLAAAEIAVLEQWIAAGAPMPDVDATAAAAPALPSTDVDAMAAGLEELAPANYAKLTGLGVKVFSLEARKALVEVDASTAGQRFGDAQVALLAPIADRIVWLDLGGTAVSDAGLAKLPALPRLQRLHLERTAVSSAGMAAVGSLTGLRYLNLYGTKVDDAGLKHLAGLTALERLYLWDSAVTEAGAKAFAQGREGLVVDRGD